MVEQEWNEDQSAHRLIDKDTGECTEWAGYSSFTYLKGIVGYSAYYGTKEGILSADDFCKMVAVK